MMYPPVAATLIASAAAKALIGSNPVRVYAAGEAPQPPTLPYVTWQTISGIPENYLGAAPDMDGYIA